MGGAELDMYILALALKKEKFGVSVITGDWAQEEIEEINGVSIYKSFLLERKLSNYICAPFKFWKSLKKVDADVYILSGAGPEVGIMALFCKLKRKRFIYRTAHIIDCDGTYVSSNGLFGLLYEYGLQGASLIVTSVAEHGIVLTDRYPGFKKKIRQINLGISSHDSLRDKDFVLWVARCERWKKPGVFLEIAAMIPLAKFVMICPRQEYNPGYFEEIKRRAQSLQNITFIDFVPFKDIQPYFDKAKVFVNTSDFEGFTYTLIQSGLSRTPVVYLSVNPDEVITKYNIGYVAGGDKEKMVEQIRTLLYGEKDWKEKSENIFRYVKENHDINIVGRQWKKVLEKI